jgi:hypothetical protein
MPIVRIDFLEGKAPEYGVQVGLIVARALTDALNWCRWKSGVA